MNLRPFFNRTRRFLIDHLPDILTYTGAIGVIATAVSSSIATVKTQEDISENLEFVKHSDYLKYGWKHFIPTTIISSVTIACIISSNLVYGKRYSELLTAYALLADSFTKYREKVNDIYGEETDEEIISSLAVERANNIPLYAYETADACNIDFGVIDGWQHLFYLRCADRYFTSTITRVMQAEYTLNRNIVMGNTCSLADFTLMLGLEPDAGETEVGWPAKDEAVWVDFNNYKVEANDKRYPREIDLPHDCPFDPDIFVIDCYLDPVRLYLLN